MQEERRTYTRTRGACDITLDAETQPPRVVKGQLLDISQTGLAMHALEPLPVNTRATVRVDTSDGSLVNESIGRGFVVGCSSGEGSGRLHLIRMQFTGANTELVQAIQLQMQLHTPLS